MSSSQAEKPSESLEKKIEEPTKVYTATLLVYVKVLHIIVHTCSI